MDKKSFLILLAELPASSSNLRVRLWRRLQKIGAIGLKGSVYVLPDTPEHLEHFSWIAQEVKTSGGSAEIFTGSPATATGIEELRERFRSDAAGRYTVIVDECNSTLESATSIGDSKKLIKTIERLRQDFQQAQKLDFFTSQDCKKAGAAIERLADFLRTDNNTSASPEQIDRREWSEYIGRRWVTRGDIFSDRLACAWFIRRFIDTEAEITFGLPKQGRGQKDAIVFDADGGEFSHVGALCTFELMVASFGLSHDPGLSRLAKIIHDIDLEEDRYGLAETRGVELYLRCLKKECVGDKDFFERGGAFLDTMYKGSAGN